MRLVIIVMAGLFLVVTAPQEVRAQASSTSVIRSVVQEVARGAVIDADRAPRQPRTEQQNRRRPSGDNGGYERTDRRGGDARYETNDRRRSERYDRKERRTERYDRNDRRYESRSKDKNGRKGKGPAFCRSGEGHPVHGRQWCRDKGFGLGDDHYYDYRRDQRRYDARDRYPVVFFRDRQN